MKGSLTIAACITNLRHDIQNLRNDNPPDIKYYQVKREMLLDWLNATMIMWNGLEGVEKSADKLIDTILELVRKCD